MAGGLDSALRAVAQAVVTDLGQALNTQLTYTRRLTTTYDIATGELTEFERPYEDIYAPVEFVRSDEESGYQENIARIYIAPEQIGGNQPTLQDEITLKYDGLAREAKIQDVTTYRGGQTYLYVVRVVF